MLQTDTMFEMQKSEIVCPLMNNLVVWPIFLSCLTAWPDDQLSGYCCIIRHWWSSWFRQHSSCAFIWSHNLIIFFFYSCRPIYFFVCLTLVSGLNGPWSTEEVVRTSSWVLDLQFRRPRVQIPPWPLPGFAHSSPEFNFLTMLVNSNLVCFQPVGILNHFMFDFNYLFQELAWPQ